MHRFYVIHGDVKPLNVLVFEGLHVKLADLGLSRKTIQAMKRGKPYVERNTDNIANSANEDSSYDSSTTDAAGGTLDYMAPELRFGDRCSFSSDIFSLGMTCIHLILGRRFASVRSGFVLAVEKMKSHLRSVYGHSQIVGRLCAFIEECMGLRKEERPTIVTCLQRVDSFQQMQPVNDENIILVQARLKVEFNT
jgi:serine/threonine protein kinase